MSRTNWARVFAADYAILSAAWTRATIPAAIALLPKKRLKILRVLSEAFRDPAGRMRRYFPKETRQRRLSIARTRGKNVTFCCRMLNECSPIGETMLNV